MQKKQIQDPRLAIKCRLAGDSCPEVDIPAFYQLEIGDPEEAAMNIRQPILLILLAVLLF